MLSLYDLVSERNLRIGPFERTIVIGYYDGPTEAFACVAGRAVYVRMIAWDEQQDLRCYAIAEIEKMGFGEIEKAFSILGPPAWPDWIVKWVFSDKKDEEQLAAFVATIRNAAQDIEFIMLGHGLSGRIKITKANGAVLHAIPARTENGEYTKVDDWLKYFC